MLKGSEIRGFLAGLLVVAAIAAVVLWRVLANTGDAPSPQAAAPQAERAQSGPCVLPRWRAAADANRLTLHALQWSPFGRPESGWATYAPLISQEVGAHCPADTGGFAESYARWQARKKLTADGVFKQQDFDLIRNELAIRRPFVQQTSKGLCPAAPDATTLASSRPEEGFSGKVVQLRPAALEAYRKMVAAAKAEGLAAKPPLLQLVSGYRGPAEEAARCEDGGCNTLTRASCSPHRSGLAIDLYLQPAPGNDPISSADENRRHMAATAEYRWLVTNAGRFGFMPYAFEPWHWEWTGEAP